MLLRGIDKLLILGHPGGLLLVQALSRVIKRSRSEREAPLHRRALPEPKQPRLDVGELVVRRAGKRQAVDPAYQGNVGDAVLASTGANDVIAISQARVEYTVETLRLSHVALHGIRNLFLGEAHKVVGLALHGTNAAVLPANPRFGTCVVVRIDWEREEVLGIIATRQVSEDGVALEHGQVVVVMVHNGGDAAVGVDGREPWFLLDVLRDVDALERVLEPVCLLELLQQDVSLVAVGGACCFSDRVPGQ